MVEALLFRLRAHILRIDRSHEGITGHSETEFWYSGNKWCGKALTAPSAALKTADFAAAPKRHGPQENTSRFGVIQVTVVRRKFADACAIPGPSLEAAMDRRASETDYVLENLCRARQEIIAHPEWFESDALERIDKAIVFIRESRPGAQVA
jgi:hypothetical protein